MVYFSYAQCRYSVTTTYLYDPNDERIAFGANGATMSYPFTFYNVATSSGGTATIAKHIGTISDRSFLSPASVAL